MRFLATVGFLAIVAVVTAGVYFFGGFYSVAATEPHYGVVDWALKYVRMASIARHAEGAPPVSLADSATIEAGARAFVERGCPQCHGAPGVEWQKFSEGLRPDPPDLKEIAPALPPQQIFWAIRNGIKMTGMPGFALIEVEDEEIWKIVAFVKKLPAVSEADFKAWTAPR